MVSVLHIPLPITLLVSSLSSHILCISGCLHSSLAPLRFLLSQFLGGDVNVRVRACAWLMLALCELQMFWSGTGRCSQGSVTRWQAHQGSPPSGIFCCRIFNIFHALCIQVFVLSQSCGLQEEGLQASVPRPCRSLFVSFLSGSQEVPDIGRTLR